MPTVRALFIFLGLAAVATETTAQDFAKGQAALDAGDAAGAVLEWVPLAEAGNLEAQKSLAQLYYQGVYLPEDHAEAVKWYRMAAEQGDAEAQISLGLAYDWGEGIPEDDLEANKWYRMAADQGHPSGQYLLASSYRNGDGVPQDMIEAVKWYTLAAEQGDGDAQWELAMIYFDSWDGDGIKRDEVVATRWLRRSAVSENSWTFGVSGNPNAQEWMGDQYATGEGVPQDDVLAYMWYDVAATNEREEAPAKRDALAAGMTAEDLAEAKRLSLACLESKLTDCGP